ncbi:MAG TPA: glycosyl transferase, partial [Jatrophihabitans sp.]|nr:glycosyl transferase [Jatrophihabitans sp.]
YLLAAPTSVRRRIAHVSLAGLTMLVSAGWWVLVVAVWPAGSRPYIGGSTNNSVLDLVFGYNGLARLFGGAGNGGTGGGGQNSGFGGATGLARLFTGEMGNEISWLLPAALVTLGAGLVVRGRAPRTDRARAALLLWGGWLLVTGLVFSYMQGTMHPYYTVVLAPPIAALVAVGGALLWRERATIGARVGLAALAVAAGGWSYLVLNRTPSWHPELRYLLLAVTLFAAVGVLFATRAGVRRAVVAAGLVTALLGTGSFAMATAASPHTGSIPSVGPAAAQASGMGSGAGGRPSGSAQPPSAGTAGAAPSGLRTNTSATSGSAGASTNAALIKALKATTGTWAAAVVGDQTAAELELATGKAVISIGGWSGTDNSPTLAQFKAYVAAGKVRYYLASGQGGMSGSSGAASQIATWVTQHFTAKTIGGVTVYDLSG